MAHYSKNSVTPDSNWCLNALRAHAKDGDYRSGNVGYNNLFNTYDDSHSSHRRSYVDASPVAALPGPFGGLANLPLTLTAPLSNIIQQVMGKAVPPATLQNAGNTIPQIQTAVNQLKAAGVSVPAAVDNAIASAAKVLPAQAPAQAAQVKANIGAVKQAGIDVPPAVDAVVTAAQPAPANAPLAPVKEAVNQLKAANVPVPPVVEQAVAATANAAANGKLANAPAQLKANVDALKAAGVPLHPAVDAVVTACQCQNGAAAVPVANILPAPIAPAAKQNNVQAVKQNNGQVINHNNGHAANQNNGHAANQNNVQVHVVNGGDGQVQKEAQNYINDKNAWNAGKLDNQARRHRIWKDKADYKIYNRLRKFLEWHAFAGHKIYDYDAYFMWKPVMYKNHCNDNLYYNDYIAWKRADIDFEDFFIWKKWADWKERKNQYKRRNRGRITKLQRKGKEAAGAVPVPAGHEIKKRCNLRNFCKFRRFCDWHDNCLLQGNSPDDLQAHAEWKKENNKAYDPKLYQFAYDEWVNSLNFPDESKWNLWREWKARKAGRKGRKCSLTNDSCPGSFSCPSFTAGCESECPSTISSCPSEDTCPSCESVCPSSISSISSCPSEESACPSSISDCPSCESECPSTESFFAQKGCYRRSPRHDYRRC